MRGFEPSRQSNRRGRRRRSGSLIVSAERRHRGIRCRDFVSGSAAVDISSQLLKGVIRTHARHLLSHPLETPIIRIEILLRSNQFLSWRNLRRSAASLEYLSQFSSSCRCWMTRSASGATSFRRALRLAAPSNPCVGIERTSAQRLRQGVPARVGLRGRTINAMSTARRRCPASLLYRPAGGTLVSTKGGSFCRGVVRSFMGCSLMPPGELGALALFPTVSASRFIRLLTM